MKFLWKLVKALGEEHTECDCLKVKECTDLIHTRNISYTLKLAKQMHKEICKFSLGLDKNSMTYTDQQLDPYRVASFKQYQQQVAGYVQGAELSSRGLGEIGRGGK